MKKLLLLALTTFALLAEVQTRNNISITCYRVAEEGRDKITVSVQTAGYADAFLLTLGTKPFIGSTTQVNFQQKLVKRNLTPGLTWTSVDFYVKTREKIDFLFVNELRGAGSADFNLDWR